MSLRYFLTRSTPTPIADSFPLIKRVMKKNGVKRLLALSTPAHSLPNEQVCRGIPFWLSQLPS